MVSFDSGYCSRMEDEVDKQTCLFVHDRATKIMPTIPTTQKGGKYLQYLTTEVVRFIVHTQHREIASRTDREPSVLALADAVRRTCRNLDIFVHDEGAPVGDHQSKGAAEVTVQILRAKAALLVQQIEDRVAGGKIIFGCNHPVFCWALIHAGWLHNLFSISAGQTAYERCSCRIYNGKLAMFGEDGLGYLRADLKAAPRWQHGIWMSKAMTAMSGDLHIIGTANGVFVTRSIRRNANPFNFNRLGDIESWPWEFGYAALGNRLVYNKRVTQPMAFGVGAAVPPQIDVEAVQVEQYALAHPNEDIEHEAEAEDAPKPSAPLEASEIPEASAGASAAEPSGSVGHVDAHGRKRADETGDADSHKRVKFADAGFSVLEQTCLVDDSSAGQRAPKTPKLDEEAEKQRLNQVTSTDLSLYEHEDQPVSISFENEDVECLEDYELTFEFYDDNICTDEEALKQLTFPYTKHEPVVDEIELQRLDSLADAVEVKKLTAMSVLSDNAAKFFQPDLLGRGEKRSTVQVSKSGFVVQGLWPENMPGWKAKEVICSR